MKADVIKISNLLNNMGLLAHAVHSGIKPTLEHQISRVWECIKDLSTDDVERRSWRDLTNPQFVFIEPLGIHCFIKLNSSVSAYIYACSMEHPTAPSLAQVKFFLEELCNIYGLNQEQLIQY